MIGSHRTSKETSFEKMIQIEKWIPHPNAHDKKTMAKHGNWKMGAILDWDYALILLKHSVMFTENIQPICLPTLPEKEYHNEFAYAVGWGTTKLEYDEYTSEYEATTLSDVPKRVSLHILEKQSCKDEFNTEICNHCSKVSNICAYGAKGYNATIMEDACLFDSGGKLK